MGGMSQIVAICLARAGMASGVAQGIQAGGLGGLHSAAAGLASLAGAGAAHAHTHTHDLDPSSCWRAPAAAPHRCMGRC